LLLAAQIGLPLSGGCSAISSNSGTSYSGPWDGQTPDGGLTGLPTDANACTPGNVQTFVSPGYRSANPVVGACTQDQINQYFTACFAPGSTTAMCSAFTQAPINATCSSCVVTNASASAYGPLVSTGALIQSNVAGCIELSEPSLLICAKSVQAKSACEAAACAANCPVSATDPSTLAAYNACAGAAAGGVCNGPSYQAPCLNVMDAEAGAYVGCLAASFTDFYEYAVPLFCGPNAVLPPPDSGAVGDASAEDAEPAPSDASLVDATLTDGSPVDGATSDAERGDAARDAGSTDAARASDAGVAAEDAGGEDAYPAASVDAEPDGAESDD
jgi:hypothetical protein